MKLQPNNANIPLTLSTKEGDWWHDRAPNKDRQSELHQKLVPMKGAADSVHGELIRAANRIYYDMYNNGGGNMADNIHGDWLEEGDEGYEEPEFELVGIFKDFFETLERWMPDEHQQCIKDAKACVLEGQGNTDICFDHLVDRVIFVIENTRNIVHSDW